MHCSSPSAWRLPSKRPKCRLRRGKQCLAKSSCYAGKEQTPCADLRTTSASAPSRAQSRTTEPRVRSCGGWLSPSSVSPIRNSWPPTASISRAAWSGEQTVSQSRVRQAVTAFTRGEIVVVTDDDDRENEGDLILAAVHTT